MFSLSTVHHALFSVLIYPLSHLVSKLKRPPQFSLVLHAAFLAGLLPPLAYLFLPTFPF